MLSFVVVFGFHNKIHKELVLLDLKRLDSRQKRVIAKLMEKKRSPKLGCRFYRGIINLQIYMYIALFALRGFAA